MAESNALKDSRKDRKLFNVADAGVYASTTVNQAVNLQAAATAAGNLGNTDLHIPFPVSWGTTITLPPGVGVVGEGKFTRLYPKGCGGFTMAPGGGESGPSLRDFYMEGDTPDSFIGIDCCPGIATVAPGGGIARIDDMPVSNVTLKNFLWGLKAKDTWHSSFRDLNTINCKNALTFYGQCVGIYVDHAILQRGQEPSTDGSFGIQVLQSNAYSDGVVRRPEDARIDGQTLVFGFDVQVECENCLVFSFCNSTVDYCVNYGIRVTGAQKGCYIQNNYIAAYNLGVSDPDNVPKLVAFQNLGVSSDGDITLKDNNFIEATSTASAAGSYAIRIGSNHDGEHHIVGNKVRCALGLETALYLDSATVPVLIQDNLLEASSISLFQFGADNNRIVNNTLNGVILRQSGAKDYFERNKGTAVTCYHGPVSITASATTVTLNLITDLGLTALPVIGSPAFLNVRVNAYQFTGNVFRGAVRGYYSAPNLIITLTTAVGLTISDIWVDLEVF